MKQFNLKFITLFTALILLSQFFLPTFIMPQTSVARASIEEKEIYKGLGIALGLVLIAKAGQYFNSSSEPPEDSDFSQEDMDLLATIIHAEARGEPLSGQIAVGAVVLNRLKSPEFPNNIRKIIYQSDQFTSVRDGQIDLQPNDTAYEAAKKAIEGEDPSQDSLYFYNPRKADSSWLFTLPVNTTIGNHVFAGNK
ncbi:MAG: cell wall hydrolase [Halanaerobiaceae bacterium]